MVLMNVETKSGWRFYGVTDERDLEKRLKKYGLSREDITRVEYEKTAPMRYKLNTVYFPNRDELKVKIARTDPRVKEELRKKAAELAKKYYAIAKSYDEDMRKHPKAAAGLKKSQEEYYRKAKELEAFAEGKGDVPDWLAKMFVNEVTAEQLRRVGYDPTHPAHLTYSADRKGIPEVPPRYHTLTRNTGIKTVPRPQLKPSVIEEKRFWLNPAPNPTVPNVASSKRESKTDYKKLGLYAAGAVLAYLILKRFVR